MDGPLTQKPLTNVAILTILLTDDPIRGHRLLNLKLEISSNKQAG